MLNKIGEIIPACLTPLPTEKSGEIELPPQAHIFWCAYQKSSSLITQKWPVHLIRTLPQSAVHINLYWMI